jgi:23S rRNA pseudouridine1911/1915/1917 synthase
VNEGKVFRDRIPEDQSPERVDRVVVRLMEGVTRAEVQRWIESGRVLIDGRPCRPKDKLRPGVELLVRPDLPPKTSAEPEDNIPFEVLFEDEHLLVVNKPPGLVVHPGRGHRTGTLVNGLLARPGFERPPSDPEDPEGYLRPGIVHRIDKDTSGVLVVAKKSQAREGLKAQLAAHSVERCYSALTIGVPRVGKVETLHGRDPRSRLRFSSKVSRGKTAITHINVLEKLAANRAALVECRLSTGRTHQIRVHLSQEANTPILADALYGKGRGEPEIVSIGDALGRQALHARVLGFEHPTTGETLRFETPLPKDMQEALNALRALS